MSNEELVLSEEYMTLGQLLKYCDVIQSGGMAKFYLQEYIVLVNGDEEMRRGRKLYAGDQVDLLHEERSIQLVKADASCN